MGCECAYMGGGEVYFEEEGSSTGWHQMAQTSTFSTTPEVEEIDFPNYDSLVGGSCETLERITSIGVTITLHSYCLQTLAAKLGGNLSQRAAAAVVDEPHKAYLGKLLPFNQLSDLTAPVVLTDVGATPIPDTEYTRTAAGIIINSAAADVTDGMDVLVDYTSAAAQVLQAFKSTGKTYAVRFPATNIVGKKGAWNVLLRRVKFSIANELGWKSQEAPSYTLEGTLLADSAIASTAAESQYMQVETTEL